MYVYSTVTVWGYCIVAKNKQYQQAFGVDVGISQNAVHLISLIKRVHID